MKDPRDEIIKELLDALLGAVDALEMYRDHGDAAGEFPMTIAAGKDAIKKAEAR